MAPSHTRTLGRVIVAGTLILLLILTFWTRSAPMRAQARLPASMAAAGDSLTSAVGSGPRYFADNTAYSWATGVSPEVNSLALRLATRNPALSGRVYNLARIGARMGDLPGQMSIVNAIKAEYVAVLVGGNDVCAPTEAAMTPVQTFRQQFDAALARLAEGSPDARVLVLSIPDPTRLVPLFRDNRSAVAIWTLFDVCPTALARPRSDAPEDVARRERVRQRVAEYNQQIAEVCTRYPRCRHDGGAVFNIPLEAADISPYDYFHLSARGQARLAEVAWAVSGF
ncbi:MAG: GDSL-type esterase/lipase family protein [Oscillochloridaceae bacterium]|nr:GDSL-type esterase/lipase family protein [Chloroflexaceae bacterium]MDW8390423.1 GDSL-type esterase/lipase family protein [Oscillochloridaceae bacterium]